MNDQNSADALPPPENAPVPQETGAAPEATPVRARARRSLAGGLALILAAIALVATAYLWYVVSEEQQLIGADINRRLGKVEGSVSALESASGRQSEDLASLKNTQEALKSAVQNLSADLNENRADWILAEVEQLLLIASQRLQLAHDIELALVALKAADRRLSLLSSPALLPVRSSLAADIRKLQSLEHADIPGITLQLASLSGAIAQLPLAAQTAYKKTEPAVSPAAVAEDNSIMRFFREIWRDVSSLVRVRRSDTAHKPLLAPEQEYFLRQNLRLMLSAAQLAALQRDQAIFEQNLSAARAWIAEYFDTGTQAVGKIQSELEAMQKARLRPDLPDLSASLAALYRAAGKQRAP